MSVDEKSARDLKGFDLNLLEQTIEAARKESKEEFNGRVTALLASVGSWMSHGEAYQIVQDASDLSISLMEHLKTELKLGHNPLAQLSAVRDFIISLPMLTATASDAGLMIMAMQDSTAKAQGYLSMKMFAEFLEWRTSQKK